MQLYHNCLFGVCVLITTEAAGELILRTLSVEYMSICFYELSNCCYDRLTNYDIFLVARSMYSDYDNVENLNVFNIFNEFLIIS